jgi:hypothetical protein
VSVSSIELLHVNTAYVRGAGGIVWPEFFARLDVGVWSEYQEWARGPRPLQPHGAAL